jgi:hypothetical protein
MLDVRHGLAPPKPQLPAWCPSAMHFAGHVVLPGAEQYRPVLSCAGRAAHCSCASVLLQRPTGCYLRITHELCRVVLSRAALCTAAAAVSQVKVTPIPGKRADHQGIRVQLLGEVELALERGHPHQFLSLGAAWLVHAS